MIVKFVLPALMTLSISCLSYADIEEHKIGLSPRGRGEILIFDSSGKEIRRIQDFDFPEHFTLINDNTMAVLDKTISKVALVSTDGALISTIPLSKEVSSSDIYSISAGFNSITVALGQRGVIVIPLNEPEKQGQRIYNTPIPATGAVLINPSTLLIASSQKSSEDEILYKVTESGATPFALKIPETRLDGISPKISACTMQPDVFLAWDRAWSRLYLLKLSGDALQIVKSVQKRSWPVITAASCRTQEEITYTSEDFFLFSDIENQERKQSLLYSPLGTVSLGGGFAAVSYLMEPDSSWPESRKNVSFPSAPPISWLALLLSAAAATLSSLLVSVFLKRRFLGKSRSAAPSPDSQSALGNIQQNPPRILPLIFLICGIILICIGVPPPSPGYNPNQGKLIAGIIISALSTIWIRFNNRSHIKTAVFPPLRFQFALIVPLLAAFSGSICLLICGFSGVPYPTKLYLWVSFLSFIATQVVYPSWEVSSESDAMPKIKWSDFILPAIVATFTLFFRLRDIPTNMHFDFTYNALYGLYLWEGLLPSVWTPGFVPAPILGTWPEILGMALVGPGELGFRLGAALFGFVGLSGVFVLTLALYKDRRTAVLSTILLAGTIPFIHFNRLNTAGVTAAVAIWALASFLCAIRSGSIRWWLIFGFWLGHCFYVWPPSRVAPLALLITSIIYLLIRPRQILKQHMGPVLAFSIFLLLIAPLIPDWKANIHLLFPRVQESMEAFKPEMGVNSTRLWTSFKAPLQNAAGWLINVPDQCTQGTKSPALNRPLVALLIFGGAILISESFFVSGAIIPWLLCFFLFCGAFADSPPYYTRLLPTLYLAAAIMARGLVVTSDAICHGNLLFRKISYLLLLVFILYISPFKEFLRYYNYETGLTGEYSIFEMVAIGRKMRQLSDSNDLYLVITGRADISLDLDKRAGRLGEILPHIFDLHVSEIRDLRRSIPMCTKKPAAFFIPAARIEQDMTFIKSKYPDAQMEMIKGLRGEILAAVVTADTVCQPHTDST